MKLLRRAAEREKARNGMLDLQIALVAAGAGWGGTEYKRLEKALRERTES